MLTEAAVAVIVFLLAALSLPSLCRGVRQYLAFRAVPADPDQHFLLGHSPRVSDVPE